MKKIRITRVQLESVVAVVKNDFTMGYEIDEKSIRTKWGLAIGNKFYTLSRLNNPYRIISSDPIYPCLINRNEKDNIEAGKTYGFHEVTLDDYLEEKNGSKTFIKNR